MKRLLALMMLIPALALAQDTAVDGPRSNAQLYPPMKGVEYFCTDSNGTRVELGQVICITASCLTWMARCEMSSNNNLAMWRKLQDGCPGTLWIDRLKRAQPSVQPGPVDAQVGPAKA